MSVYFISFYNSYPITSGASNVTTNFYKYCPYKKKLFLINHEKNFKDKNVINFKPMFNNPFFKFLVLFRYLYVLIKYIKKDKPKIIVFEGASWIGYSLLFYLILKLNFKKISFIYHSHNIEFDIRRKNYFLGKLTYVFEKIMINNIDKFTVVSKTDQRWIFKLYKKKVSILKNGVVFSKLHKLEKKNVILFSGSLEFSENKIAFKKFYKIVHPLIKSKYKNFKIIVTGNKSIITEDVIQTGVLNYSKYKKLLRKTKVCIYPFRKGPGTKIKVIEALCYDIPVLSNKYGYQGIDLKNKNKLIFKNKLELKNKLNLILKNKKATSFKTIFEEAKKNFNMKTISNDFFNKLQN